MLRPFIQTNIWKLFCEVLLRGREVLPLKQSWLKHDFWKWLLCKGNWVQQMHRMLKNPMINLQTISKQERGQRGVFQLFTEKLQAQWIRPRNHILDLHQGIIVQSGDRLVTLSAYINITVTFSKAEQISRTWPKVISHAAIEDICDLIGNFPTKHILAVLIPTANKSEEIINWHALLRSKFYLICISHRTPDWKGAHGSSRPTFPGKSSA